MYLTEGVWCPSKDIEAGNELIYKISVLEQNPLQEEYLKTPFVGWNIAGKSLPHPFYWTILYTVLTGYVLQKKNPFTQEVGVLEHTMDTPVIYAIINYEVMVSEQSFVYKSL